MNTAGWITLITIALAALMLITERVRPDLVGLLVLITLTITGVVTSEEALSGFSWSAVITILAVFILAEGLERTRAIRWIGQRIVRLAGDSQVKLSAALVLTSAGLAAFMPTIAAAAVLLPTTMMVARQTKIRPSQLLMPLAFSALLGGTTTLLTTANIIVSSTLEQSGLEPFGLFEFTPIGLPLVFGGTLLMLWLGPKLLPQRDVAGQIMRMQRLHSELAHVYHLEEGLYEATVQPNSPLSGLTLEKAGLGEQLGLTVLRISQGDQTLLAPDRDAMIQGGDRLLLTGTPNLEQLESLGVELRPETKPDQKLISEDISLIEAVLAPRSTLEGRTLKEVRFRDRYGLQVIAIWREGEILQEEIADHHLRFGEAMLIQGPKHEVELLRMDPSFLILEEEVAPLLGRRALLASIIMVISLAVAATQILPIAITLIGGAAAMVLTGCLTMDDAYQAIEWKAIFLIAGMLPLSIALDKTGTADVLGRGLLSLIGGMGGIAMASVLLLTTAGLSLILGGQAAAVIMAPIGIAAARLANTDPRATAMTIAIGCSLAFISPLGHPANLLVMASGGYTFRDYVRFGAPLTLITMLLTLAGLHWIWGL